MKKQTAELGHLEGAKRGRKKEEMMSSLMASNVAKKTDTGERVGSPQIVKNEK